MNVTSNGYYTTQYLDRYRIKPSPRSEYSSSSLLSTPRPQPAVLNDASETPRSKKVMFKNENTASIHHPESRPPSVYKSDPRPTSNNDSRPTTRSDPRPTSNMNESTPTSPADLPVAPANAKSPKNKSTLFNLSPISKFTSKKEKEKDELEIEDLSEPDDLVGEITPAQLNMIQYNLKKDADIRKQLERRKKRQERKQRYREENRRPDIIHGRSYYDKIDNKRPDIAHSRSYYDIYRRSSNSSSENSSGDESSIYYERSPQSKPSRGAYGNYYVTEKMKFDESPFKSKMYTHKTFKEVFQNKNENMDRYNPSDYVFEPTEDPDENPKFKSALKALQSKMGKQNYNDYDYYAQKKLDDEKRVRIKKKRVEAAEAAAAAAAEEEKESKEKIVLVGGTRPSEIFVTNSSDGSDDEVFDGTQELKKKNYKKLWKKKLKLIKKELGQDYIKNYHENVNGEKQLKQRNVKLEGKQAEMKLASETPKKKSNKIEELDSDDSYNDNQSLSSEDSGYNPSGPGPNPAFNPVWNYVLSWLVYDTPAPKVDNNDYDTSDFSDVEDDAFAHRDAVVAHATAAGSAKATGPRERLRKQNKKKKKNSNGMKLNLQGWKKNYKSMITNWNQPASALFAGDLANLDDDQREALAKSMVLSDNKSLIRSSKSTVLSSRHSLGLLTNQESEEIELEVPSDFDEDQELYYNPATGALDSMPPTSNDAMKTSGFWGFGTSLKIETAARGGVNTPHGQLTGAKEVLLHVNSFVRFFPLIGPMFSVIDTIRNNFPHLDTAVLIGELLLFTWCLYLATVMVNAVCTAIQAICGPIIAIGRLLNRIM